MSTPKNTLPNFPDPFQHTLPSILLKTCSLPVAATDDLVFRRSHVTGYACVINTYLVFERRHVLSYRLRKHSYLIEVSYYTGQTKPQKKVACDLLAFASEVCI